jgi:leukotriene-A4 hydrolase
MDPTTQANYLDVVSQHVALKWSLNFETEIISGSATHTLLVKKENVKEVMQV